MEIRSFRPSDTPALYRVCLQTGNAGEDATGHVDDDILGHMYLGPYLQYEPELCLTLVSDGEPIGYIVGTDNTERFATQCEKEWWPAIRERYPLPNEADRSFTAQLIREIHQMQDFFEFLEDYPAHLHIDLLPAGQGCGFGRRLIDAFKVTLAERQVRGVHFGVSNRNQKAIGFYKHIGFEVLREGSGELIMGSPV